MKILRTIVINEEECVGTACGFCIRVCPSDAISVGAVAKVNREVCTGCLKCTKNICPNYAIAVKEGSDG